MVCDVAQAPMFESASHALHVSFLIHSLPPNIKSPTSVLVDALMKSGDAWDGSATAPRARVNFAGLSPLEVRAQAALVVALVGSLEHPAEAAVCKAMYGHQVIKADGVRGLAQYVQPVLNGHPSLDYALYVVWWHFMTDRQRKEVPLAVLAQKFKCTVQQASADSATVKRYTQALHARALDAVTDRFKKRGILRDE